MLHTALHAEQACARLSSRQLALVIQCSQGSIADASCSRATCHIPSCPRNPLHSAYTPTMPAARTTFQGARTVCCRASACI
jgi:hypothetical protein